MSVCVRAAEGEVRIVGADASGMRLVYEPEEPTRRQIRRGEETAEILEVAGCENVGAPGEPMLPVRSVLVGVPPEAQVLVDVVETSDDRWPVSHIAPVPHVVWEEDGWSGEQFMRDERAYARDAFVPEEVVRIGREGFLRDQRVVMVTFCPVRYNPVRKEALIYRRIVAEVRFVGRGGEGMGTEDRTGKRLSPRIEERAMGAHDRCEELYTDTILNYEQARVWRRAEAGRGKRAARNSPFATGRWLKLAVKVDGMYRVMGEELEAAGVVLSEISPHTIRMFYGGGEELPQSLRAPRREEMEEVALLVEDGGDGRFDPEDHLLFWGQGPSRWDYDRTNDAFRYRLNPYTHENIYWLTFGEEAGKRMEDRDASAYTAEEGEVARPRTFRHRVHEEAEKQPQSTHYVRDSGTQWYWEDEVSRRYSFLAQAPDEGDTTIIRVRMLGISGDNHRVALLLNDAYVGTDLFTGVGAYTLILGHPGGLTDGLNLLGIQQQDASDVRLDWYEIEYSRRFDAESGELFFASPVSSGPAEFRIFGVQDPAFDVFEVSDPFNVARIIDTSYDPAEGMAAFGDVMDSEIPRQYYLVSRSRWKRPDRVWMDAPSDLRDRREGADYMVITHGEFLDQAHMLAEWRGQDDRFGPPLRTAVVDVQDIYDEFAWGLFDPTAIRDFLRYAVENWAPAPYMVVLLGDGCFDYKNNYGMSPPNRIPPYEDNDWGLTYDEWYVRVVGTDDVPDLSIGRLAVRTREEAQTVVDKLIEYDRSPERGGWQNTVLLVADDEKQSGKKKYTEPEFTRDQEDLSKNFLPERLDQVKVYLMEYDLVGRFKPDAQRDFVSHLNRGAVFASFIGHSNKDVIAHEHVFVGSSDMSLLHNGRRLPLLYTAACAVGQFDHPVDMSLAELMLKYPEGGVIAMIGSTRLAYHDRSMALKRSFLRHLFFSEKGPERIGMAFWKAKTEMAGVWTILVTQCYTLFGDPATRLALPELGIQLASADTLRALERIQVSGTVRSSEDVASNFEGQVVFRALDSAVSVKRTVDTGERLEYMLPGAPIFRGTFPVQAGRFEAAFVVPKDITYGGRLGRLSAFVWNDQISGSGELEPLFVGGTASAPAEDATGPKIEIGFEDQTFSDGDYVSSSPVLVVALEDESGINVTGEIGHEIVVKIDENTDGPTSQTTRILKVTEYFAAEDGYRRGRLRYPIPALKEGEHVLHVKAWDTFNNSSKESVRIRVASEARFSLSEVLCHPNPMAEETTFTYRLSHPAESVDIRVFTLSGRSVDGLTGEGRRGYNQVRWTPTKPLANGPYLYRIMAMGPEGERAEMTERLVVMR